MNRRTTLRPAEAAVPQPEVPSDEPPRPAPNRSAADPRTLALVVVSAVAVAAVAVLIYASLPRPPAPAEVSAGATVSQCPPVASFLDVIANYERQARWALAAAAAQSALRTPGICEADRAALAQKFVALSREALFEQPPAVEDAPGQRRIAMAYVDLKASARQYGMLIPPPLPIARSAYDNRLFLLAIEAYADAFNTGESSSEDRDVVRADYSAQRNLGLAWARRSDTAQRQEGLARLATACRIDERLQLSSQEACNDLRLLVGARDRWPQPLSDPLLDVPLAPTTAITSQR